MEGRTSSIQSFMPRQVMDQVITLSALFMSSYSQCRKLWSFKMHPTLFFKMLYVLYPFT